MNINNEILADKKLRTRKIVKSLKNNFPFAKTALQHNNPLEMLIATILSAQCTDERVNKVTPKLFRKYKSAHDYANANAAELENEIKSTGFYRAKAKNIINCCKTLDLKYNGKVPQNLDELVQLPGVGRKTANVVLGACFGIASGIVVDTHVMRIVKRLGLTTETNPEKIETDLMKIISKRDWIAFGDLIIWHGRKVCAARKPKCSECSIQHLCPSKEALY